ncbi:CPBP family intramembrane glutamic endopeptidase [Natrialba swarupiae]|uniref:CPBP family intramembrane metalloprotease n=1 Tax=Natrialba swarupiae TaxID=2448032 RepID=A0A5D5AN76_9EURY|nr:type II CAAX endopeptidase family protein [Natrialba swarupiae]TYT63309.1 CPBP family intramembrane metalloprotease [Natrialba swarupiae]
MTETARPDGTSVPSAVVPGIGAALSLVTLIALLVPVQRGLEDPAIWAALTLTGVATLAFLVGVHDDVDHRIGGGIALSSSVGVLLLVGYAMNQGHAVPVPLDPLPVSFPLLFGAFVTAGLGIGLGAASYADVDPVGLLVRSGYTAGMMGVGVVGLFSIEVVLVLLVIPIILLFGSLSLAQAVALSQLGMAVGTGTVAVAYLVFRGYDLSYIDVRLPTKRDVLWTVGGVLVIFGALFAISAVFYTTGVESSDHGTAQQAQENPEILLILIPASLLVIGPFEELLYRNVIQKALYAPFSRFGAVVVGSVIFAIVHTQAYWTAGTGELVASLAVVFGLSIVLGVIYERTENLVVPALIHGVYNAILFTNLYLGYA